MKKVTVKHYLNTNLKPYIVRGEKYYTVYMLVTVNRKTTRIPSKEFEELHTEEEFENEILPSEELQAEVKTVENIIKTQLAIDNDEFNTLLFSALYNFMPKYSLSKADSDVMYHIADMNDYEGKYMQSGWSFYDWYRDDVQKVIQKKLEDCGNETWRSVIKTKKIENINQAVMICFFNVLAYITPSTAKYKILGNQYEMYYCEGIDVIHLLKQEDSQND